MTYKLGQKFWNVCGFSGCWYWVLTYVVIAAVLMDCGVTRKDA